MEQESLKYDLVIVGAGPAGLSAAIKFKQLCQAHHRDYSVCVLEKASEIGGHILSGAIFEPRALNELLPNWRHLDAPLKTPVSKDHFLFLSQKGSIPLPTPPQMHNRGNYIISLGNLCRWLGDQASQLGVDLFPGFAAQRGVYDGAGHLVGIETGPMGLDKDGHQTDRYQPGMVIHATHTLLAEGCRGSLTQEVTARFALDQGREPQTYGLGLKELWEVDPAKHKLGTVLHTVGWPLDTKTYGGSFVYHLEDNLVSVGYVVGLDYDNPYLSPFEEFQRFKNHPKIRPLFEGGRRIAYGARALNEGGFQSIPKLSFPGGALIGCAAGFLNVAKIKGSHTAMKSGMLAAETAFNALLSETPDLGGYDKALKKSWVYKELKKVRNIRPGFHKGLWAGMVNGAFETLTLGLAPWTLKHRQDHKSLKNKKECQPIDYPKPDGVVTFDRLSSVYLSNTNHGEDQPCHLVLKNAQVPIEVNLALYDAPEQRYCPAGVYEIVQDGAGPRLQINAQNCVHCKTCDIKDPTQNITWVPPQGGDGPNYPNM